MAAASAAIHPAIWPRDAVQKVLQISCDGTADDLTLEEAVETLRRADARRKPGERSKTLAQRHSCADIFRV